MTPTERAHAIVERAVVRTYNLHASDEYNRQCTVEDIVAALHAERQAVWEEVITIAEHLYAFCETGEKIRVVATLVQELRQRAKERG